MFKSSLAFAAAASVLLVAPVAASPEQPTASAELQVAMDYVAAYNARDLDAMMALMHDDVEWLSVEGSAVQVFAKGKPDLAAQMEGYFASSMATISTIDGSVSNGRFVAVRELARWTGSDGEPREQAALAIYEFDEGLVRRVWYYPASN